MLRTLITKGGSKALSLNATAASLTPRGANFIRNPLLRQAIARNTLPSVSLGFVRHYAQPPGGGGGGFPGFSMGPQHQKGEALKEYVSTCIWVIACFLNSYTVWCYRVWIWRRWLKTGNWILPLVGMKVRMYYLLSIEIFLNSCYTEIRRTIQSKVSFIIYISPSSRFDAVLSRRTKSNPVVRIFGRYLL